MDRHSFALEHLEGRALFSVAAPMCAAPVTTTTAVQAITQAAAHSPFGVSFNVAGNFTHPLGNPDTGSRYYFRGVGKTNALGDFTLKGYIQPPGLIANGHARGILIITTSTGTIRLSVTGPASSGALPSTLSFRIVRGTDAYLGSSGTGTIGVSASGTTHKFLFRFHPTT